MYARNHECDFASRFSFVPLRHKAFFSYFILYPLFSIISPPFSNSKCFSVLGMAKFLLK